MNDATTSKETCSIFAALLSAEARRSNIRDGRRGMQSQIKATFCDAMI